MAIEQHYLNTLNKEIKTLIQSAIKVSFKKPAFLKFIVQNALWQNTAEKLRSNLASQGYNIPPFLIASVTSECNLMCKGCYDQDNKRSCKEELPLQRWLDIFGEAKSLGISFILVAGGEPFMRKDLIAGLGLFPEIIFPIFTNGTYIDEETLRVLDKSRNCVPIVSLEGFEADTDERRGTGVYQKVRKSMDAFNQKSIFFGASITVTRDNYALVTSDVFVKDLAQKGCKIFFYVEYIPLDPTTEHLQINEVERLGLAEHLDSLRESFSALFISFPGDENLMGGCLSSGRGFVHISASGDLEPCPFSPYSDVNVKGMTLKDALQSNFLRSIRESGEHLSETEKGCALFNKKDWVVSLLNKN
ncbi:MAG: radical SAM protein [Vallitaleaceae bacterium]|nr:radical SAM protein [Vallitaleaceae bacterium]